MIAQFMIEEIEGILTLLTRRPEQKVLEAIATLPSEDIKAYRDSLARRSLGKKEFSASRAAGI